jgi:transposase
MSSEIAGYLQDQVAGHADLTLVELQRRLLLDNNVRFSSGRLWQLLKQFGLRLEKGRSTPPNATPRARESGAKSCSKQSARLGRNA